MILWAVLEIVFFIALYRATKERKQENERDWNYAEHRK